MTVPSVTVAQIVVGDRTTEGLLCHVGEYLARAIDFIGRRSWFTDHHLAAAVGVDDATGIERPFHLHSIHASDAIHAAVGTEAVEEFIRLGKTAGNEGHADCVFAGADRDRNVFEAAIDFSHRRRLFLIEFAQVFAATNRVFENFLAVERDDRGVLVFHAERIAGAGHAGNRQRLFAINREFMFHHGAATGAEWQAMHVRTLMRGVGTVHHGFVTRSWRAYCLLCYLARGQNVLVEEGR